MRRSRAWPSTPESPPPAVGLANHLRWGWRKPPAVGLANHLRLCWRKHLRRGWRNHLRWGWRSTCGGAGGSGNEGTGKDNRRSFDTAVRSASGFAQDDKSSAMRVRALLVCAPFLQERNRHVRRPWRFGYSSLDCVATRDLALAMKSASGMEACSFLPRVRTLTVPAPSSLSPKTRM